MPGWMCRVFNVQHCLVVGVAGAARRIVEPFWLLFFLRGVEHEVGTGQGRQRSVHDVAGPSLVPRSYRHKD